MATSAPVFSGYVAENKRAERPTLWHADQNRARRASGVHHRPRVVHALLERGELTDRHWHALHWEQPERTARDVVAFVRGLRSADR